MERLVLISVVICQLLQHDNDEIQAEFCLRLCDCLLILMSDYRPALIETYSVLIPA